MEEKNNYPIVFIHGIMAGFEKWRELGKELSQNKNYFEYRYGDDDTPLKQARMEGLREVWNISYYTKKIMKESFEGELMMYAVRTNHILDKILEYSGSSKIILICHSMGGLIARRAISITKERANIVHKIVTVATPNKGVGISPKIVGQLRDLKENSKFIIELENDWEKLKEINKNWGVIGAVDEKNIFNRSLFEFVKKREVLGSVPDNFGKYTDSAGPGYITIESAIPYNEWRLAISSFNEASYDSEIFGFRMALESNHNDVLKNIKLKKAIEWAKN